RYPDVSDAIGFRARTQASFDAAEALLNRREVDSAFFEQLLDERPKGREEISRAATAFGVAVPNQSSRSTTPVRSRRARHRPASSAPAGDTYTHHGGQVGAMGRNAVSSGNMFFQNAEVVHVHAPPSDSPTSRRSVPPMSAQPSMRDLFEARTENAAILKAAVQLLSTGLPADFEPRWNLLRQHLGDKSVRALSVSGSLQDVARTLSVRLLHDFGGEGRQALAKLIRELIEESPNSEWCGAANALLQRLPQYQAPSLISDEQADSVSVEKVHASIQRTVTAGARALRVPSSTITATIEHPVSSLRDYFSRCIAESSRQPIGDRRFVALSLLIDRRQNGQAQGPERFNVERDRYQSLRGAVEDNDDCELVVVGPPGAGKSTLLSQYRYELCELGLQGKSAPIPFLVHLGGYGRDDGERVPSPDEWLAFQWQHVMPNLPLADAMATRPFVLLLDALNEMPREAHATLEARIGVWQDWLSSFHAQTKGRHRVVFSCRARDLSASLSSARPVRLLEIDALDDERVKYFLSEHAGRHADAIYSKIQKNDRLRSLYRTPLSLTLLLDLIEFCGSIPSTPAALFTGHLCYAVRREIDNGNPRFRAGKYLSASDVNHMLLAPFRLDEPYALPDDGPLFRGLVCAGVRHAEGGRWRADPCGDEACGSAPALQRFFRL
ncbi:MAG: NACHT domain-containing protein, partial [Pseudomonadota bacterium]